MHDQEIAALSARYAPGNFLLAMNGEPVAWTDPHGAALEWISTERQGVYS